MISKFCTVFFALIGVLTHPALAWSPLAIVDDPLVRMPGTQSDNGVNLENPNRCLNCHAGFDPATEPGFQWTGSMMAQSARDPLFWASITVAGQDSIWALGNPNAVDICERCHFPEGWLGGRSDPANASLMTASDFDGVHCDFCHRMYDPFFEETYSGTRESADWLNYWDEASTLSQILADETLAEDQALAQTIKLFSGQLFFGADNHPVNPGYTENTSGQYFVSPDAQKRASFADADARHQMLYSRHHKSKYFCGTCHDVSNPVLANLSGGVGDLTTEQFSASSYFHVERTFSEFQLSAYGQEGGAPTNPEFQAQGAPNITHAAKCQDCHMRDVTGAAANKKNTVVRPDDSSEHPESGQPLHDLTGGNVWVPHILASLDPNGLVYDPVNLALLDRGPAVLTLDLNAGQSPKVNGAALKAGSDRARQQLLLAATLKNVNYDATTGQLSFRLQNNTGHKLLTGFPEGRRMFVNIQAFDASNNLIYEVNPYDYEIGTLKGMPDTTLGVNEVHVDSLVYEAHTSSSLTGEDHTLHFVLADGRSKDNRIPPKGFASDQADTRHAQAVGVSFTPDEYLGGYDEQSVAIIPNAAVVMVNVYYQGTSREYIAFLRDEINGTGQSLPVPAYIVQTDPFFSQLKAWGDTIWDLWYHNHGLDGSGVQVDGIVPFKMATATVGEPPPVCETPENPPNLVVFTAKYAVELGWNIPNPAPQSGYRVYFGQPGKQQLIAQTSETHYSDTDPISPIQICHYAVTAWNDCNGNSAVDANEESAKSTIPCATTTDR